MQIPLCEHIDSIVLNINVGMWYVACPLTTFGSSIRPWYLWWSLTFTSVPELDVPISNKLLSYIC